MCRKRITSDLRELTAELMKSHSNLEIADKLKISVSTVKRIIKENDLKRSDADSVAIRSRTRKELIRAERRRAIFGLDQKTFIKVFTNSERNKLKYCLKRRRYIFLKRGENIAYFNSFTNRYPPYEERGVKLGLKFEPIDNQ